MWSKTAVLTASNGMRFDVTISKCSPHNPGGDRIAERDFQTGLDFYHVGVIRHVSGKTVETYSEYYKALDDADRDYLAQIARVEAQAAKAGLTIGTLMPA